MLVKLYLTVIDGSKFGWEGSGELWYKEIQTGQVPSKQDEIVLYEDGPLWGVKRSYLDHIGLWNIELHRLIKNPREHLNVYGTDRPWWTSVDHQPEPKLLAGGWQIYLPLLPDPTT